MLTRLRASLPRALGAFSIALALLLIGSAAAAAPNVTTLIQRLKKGADFRVRVQAALELGKSRSSRARLPLERALEDDNAAVRAASAAALKVLGDKRSIAALKLHRLDRSAAVRAQIKSTIAALKRPRIEVGQAKILVKLGKMRARGRKNRSVLEKTSRKKLGEIPGVRVVDHESQAPRGKKLPVVLVTGKVRRLKQSRKGDGVEISAKVEYIVHRMPSQAMAGTVSGSAKTTASRQEARDKRRSAELRRRVLNAAVESALRRVPEALAAAANYR